MTTAPALETVAPEFVRMDHSAQLGMVAKDHYVEIFPPAGDLPAANVYALSRARLGGNGLLRIGPALFLTRDTTPGYYNRVTPIWYHGLMRDDLEVLVADSPIAVLVQPNWVYGHVLLEMLPKMFLYGQLALVGRGFPVALSRHAPPFLRRILSLYVDDHSIIEYDPVTQQVSAPLFIVPSIMNWNYRLHPMFNALVDDLLTRCLLKPDATILEILPPRIFLSRVRLPAHSSQRVGDPRALEEVFRRRGFAIVYPETLDFPQQMALYRRCAILAGVAGSALHNSLFMPPGSQVIAIGSRNHIQQEICTLRRQSLSVLSASDSPDEYAIDLPTLTRELDAALDASSAT